jgi:hypothetical protein
MWHHSNALRGSSGCCAVQCLCNGLCPIRVMSRHGSAFFRNTKFLLVLLLGKIHFNFDISTHNNEVRCSVRRYIQLNYAQSQISTQSFHTATWKAKQIGWRFSQPYDDTRLYENISMHLLTSADSVTFRSSIPQAKRRQQACSWDLKVLHAIDAKPHKDQSPASVSLTMNCLNIVPVS